MKKYLFLLLLLVSCTTFQEIPGKYSAEVFCDSDIYSTYKELPDTINVNTRIIYFTSSNYVTPLNIESINSKLEYLQVRLDVESHIIIKDKAIVNTFSKLQATESVSDYFYMVDSKYNDDDYLNIYIVPKSKSPVIGRAKDIPSNSLIMREYTGGFEQVLVHELGHTFGLFHTHEYDSSEFNNNYHGDRVCDTPICNQPIREISDTTLTLDEYNVLLHNFMSYPPKTIHMTQFTPVQKQRVRFMFENVPTLRKLINYD